MRNPAVTWIFLLVAVFLLCGCSPWIRLEQPIQNGSVPLEPEKNLGQTFTAHENGLQGIAVYLSQVEQGQGVVHLNLKKNTQDPTAIITSTIPISKIQNAGWYRFNFPGIDGSAHQDYYYDLDVDGTGKLAVATGPADAYLDGALDLAGQPLEAQASFRLAYDPLLATIGMAREFVQWLLYLLTAVWLFILPGWGLLSILYAGWTERAWMEKGALAAGLSLALYPVLFLWTSIVGLRLGAVYAWLPGLAGAILIGYRQLTGYRSAGLSTRLGYRRENILADAMLILILVIVIFSRFWVIRGLDFPMWGDSYQHTMIAQLLVDNQGLFNSWQPYTDLQSFTYHFGFHTIVSVFYWVTGLSMPVATLWTGQIVNILAIFTLVPLANRLGRNHWAGVIAILVAGLLSLMPQVYLNWGRYTQLAGQAILPVAVTLSLVYLEGRSEDKRLITAISLILAGLALTHYRILVFSAFFYLAFFILKVRQEGILPLVRKITWIGLGAVLLFLPWLVHIFEGGIPDIATSQLTTPVSQLSAFTRQYNSIGNISTYLSPLLWSLMLLSAAWGFWRREIDAAIITLWWFLILLAANPQWLKLPGSGLISNFAVFIAMYIPAGVLIGAAAGWLAGLTAKTTRAQRGFSTAIQIILAFVVIIFGYYGVQSRLKDDNRAGSVLFTRADQRAAQWVDANLPDQARILVNAFFAYGDWVTVGSDGGWWLPLTAHRQTSLPPINYGNENGATQDYRQQVNALQSEILAKGIEHPDVLNALRQRGIDYIYIGQRQGRVNNPGAFIDPQVLLGNPAFKPIYHQDRVYVFEIVR